MLWFWFRKTILGQRDDPQESKLKPLYDGDRGLNDLYANEAELRVWVPEPVSVAMKEATDWLDTPLSKYLRDFLVAYLYGAHELLCMHENKTGIFHPAPPPAPKPSGGVRFSRARTVDYIPGLGKNIFPLKLFLHQKMKDDLQALADKAGVPLSQFVREILVSHFLGHTVWPERVIKAAEDEVEIAQGWVDGVVEEECAISATPETDANYEGLVVEIR